MGLEHLYQEVEEYILRNFDNNSGEEFFAKNDRLNIKDFFNGYVQYFHIGQPHSVDLVDEADRGLARKSIDNGYFCVTNLDHQINLKEGWVLIKGTAWWK